MTIKEGDFISEAELVKDGWDCKAHISGGTFAYKKDTIVIFWVRSSHRVMMVREYPE
jgi:hypothetical protein